MLDNLNSSKFETGADLGKIGVQITAAGSDWLAGLLEYRIWVALGWLDIVQRYRRSVLGPIWLTLSTGIMVFAIGLIYAKLFRQEIADYMPYLGMGLILWLFISTVLNEACLVFVSSEAMIKQVRLPLSVHVLRFVYRNLLILLHNALIAVAIILWFQPPIDISILTVVPALLLFLLFSFSFGFIFGILAARYRDSVHMVATLTQLLFFLSPIMWKPEVLEERIWVALYNPITHVINIVRLPLLGQGIPFLSWIIAGGACATLLGLALFVFAKMRTKIVYWI